MLLLKSSNIDNFVHGILSFAKRGCAALATHVMLVMDSTRNGVELDSNTSLLANFSVSTIIEQMPTNLVVSSSYCISRSFSLASTKPTVGEGLARVHCGSNVH
jgi:hypothetical protein